MLFFFVFKTSNIHRITQFDVPENIVTDHYGGQI